MAFVASSAPQGWKLGRWSQVNQSTWQEEKLDNPQIVYQFQVVSGPSMPGSKTVRLKMKDQNTEVLLLDSSAQVFVNGNYFGEYAGEWQNASKGRAAPAARQSQSQPAAAPAPAPAAARGKGNSKEQQAYAPPAGDQGAAFEQTLAPEQVAPAKGGAKKAAPAPAPAAGGGGGGAYGGGGGGVSPAKEYMTRENFQPWQVSEQRAGKAQGLDKSDASMQKLITAAKNGDVNQVKQLLGDGIDPDGPAKDGQTPLMAATRGGHTAVVEALLGACADPTLGKGDETPLTIAFQKGNQNLLKVLMAGSFSNLNGLVGPANINIPQGLSGATEEVGEDALDDLREVTKMIASHSKIERQSPTGGKYGHYSHLTASQDMGDKDYDDMRTAAVKMTMKSLVKTTREGGIGSP